MRVGGRLPSSSAPPTTSTRRRCPLAEQIKEINPGGADYAIDTTAVTPVVEQLLASLGMLGKLGLIGVPADPQAVFSVGLFQPPLLGLTIRGIVEGDADPQTFIPYLLDLHRQGKFPFDKLITTMPWRRSTRRWRPSTVARSSKPC